MKYQELKEKIDEEIQEILNINKKLYEARNQEVNKYNTYLMKSEIIASENISSVHMFEGALKYMNKLQDIKNKEILAKVVVMDWESESIDGLTESVDITYSVEVYTPVDNVEVFTAYKQKEVFKTIISKHIGVHFHYQVDCKILELYKKDIITLEQLKAAHQGVC